MIRGRGKRRLSGAKDVPPRGVVVEKDGQTILRARRTSKVFAGGDSFVLTIADGAIRNMRIPGQGAETRMETVFPQICCFCRSCWWC